jgi:peptidoglycan hydrolase CwlO-like protein
MEKLKAAFQTILNFLKGINRRLLVDIIVVGGIAFIIYLFYITRTPSEVKKTLKDNATIQVTIDSLTKYNQSLNSKLTTLEDNQSKLNDNIDYNNKLIQENNSQITKLNKSYKNEISTINNYTPSQLDSFFAKRYGR